jgi:hypothetical protein
MANTRSDTYPRGRYSAGGTTESQPDRIGWWERKIFPRADTDVEIIITPKYALRPDALAFDLYGSSTLMWAVLQYNNIIDINTEFVEGVTLIVPTKARLLSQLLISR